MPERRECTFCGEPIEPGTGKQHIKNTGKVFHFCSNKCRKNLLNLNRTARETKWTKRYAQDKAIETYRKKGAEQEEEQEEKGNKKRIKRKKD